MARNSSHHWSYRTARFLLAPVAFLLLGVTEQTPVIPADCAGYKPVTPVVLYAKVRGKYVPATDPAQPLFTRGSKGKRIVYVPHTVSPLAA